MNRTIAMRRCALVCALFTLTSIIPIFGQTLTETITHPLIDPLPQEGAFELLVPCGGPVDDEDAQIEGYLMNIQLSGLTEGEYYELVYNADFFATNGVQNIQLDAEVSETSFDIPIGFCNYVVSNDPLQASYQLYLGGVMDGELVASLMIVYDPFVINNPNYDLTTTYYDGVEIDVDNDMDLIIPPNGVYPNSSNLYYQNDSHPFSRITDITLDDNGLVPNSLTLFYIPEDEIAPLLVRIECVDPGCSGSSIDITDFTTIPVEIPLDGWPVDELAGGHSIRVVEEFVIQDCGTVADVAETAFRLSPCGCGDFVQTHTMNALVTPYGGNIQFCFNMERDGVDIEGIPLFNDGDDDFDIRYTFSNPAVSESQSNTGHKEMGWIVVPIDLRPLIPTFDDSWTIEQVNTWLSANTYLQLDPYVDIPEGAQPGCQIEGTDPDSPIILAPDGFVQVYQNNIGMTELGECDVQQNLDLYRRIAFDFSKLTNDYALAHTDVLNTDGPLTNWYGDGEANLWNTFMEGTSFSLLIKNLEFDHTMFRSVNGNSTIANDAEIIDEYYFLHSCDPEGACSYTCGAGG
ncbi:MAG: hypothetical protein KDC12_14360, partial [Flavobacteriales bacterium]|nr:hypothetical protein [Flavobacteriales bacterium]